VSEALNSLLIALADDELILGHRHSEWTGFAPHIEEDVAFSSIAQDEIGHAAALYTIAAELTDDVPDRLALGREKSEYRNAIFCERPNGDWSYTLARHWLYDRADAIRLEALEGTKHDALRSLVVKMRREERYHTLHADLWIKRVAHGPVEGRTKLIDATGIAFEQAVGLFEPFEYEDEALAEGWLPLSSAELRGRFVDQILGELDELGFPSHITQRVDEAAEFVASSSGDLIASESADDGGSSRPEFLGGRKGRHTPDLDALWDDLTAMYRTDPGARW
jgi:ring-1,2-phenylacetyl-CoA epoxidase subunit PaaC